VGREGQTVMISLYFLFFETRACSPSPFVGGLSTSKAREKHLRTFFFAFKPTPLEVEKKKAVVVGRNYSFSFQISHLF
jgi:hypothetical protein